MEDFEMTLMKATVPASEEDVFIILNHDMLIEFLEWQKECIAEDLSYFIRKAIPADRWDHYTPKCMLSIHAMACNRMQMGSVAPLFAHTEGLKEYALSLFSAHDRLTEGQHIAINRNGGYNTVRAGEFTDLREHAHEHVQNTFLRSSANLVLENDPQLPEWTLKNYADASYIVNLRSLDVGDLYKAMQAFIADVPDMLTPHLVVYTTGMDKDQMYDYIDTATRAGIKRLTWYTQEKLETFTHAVQYAEDTGMTVEVINTIT
jgi:hypothetical protein